MGEMVDDHIDRMIERGSWGFACRRITSAPKKPTCTNCGAKNVHWRLFAGKYKLADDQRQHPGNRYIQHNCPTSADGFGDCDA